MPARALPLWEMQGATTAEDDPQAPSAPEYEFDQRIAYHAGIQRQQSRQWQASSPTLQISSSLTGVRSCPRRAGMRSMASSRRYLRRA